MPLKPIVLALSVPAFLVLFVARAPAGDAAIPRPEHPLPQMMRSEWLNLNGVWEFAETDDSQDESFFAAAALPDRITVPFLNGLEIWRGEGWNDSYAAFDISEGVKKNLRPGNNLIAVHCHQDEGGQFIDLAILLGAGG